MNMPFASHLTGELRIFRYASPAGRHHQPRRIASDREEVEVIVAGRGAFGLDDDPEENGPTVDAGPGSALWYGPGAWVTVTTDQRDPYETVVFVFGISAPPAMLPARHGVWLEAAECVQFCRRALNAFERAGSPEPHWAGCHYARLFWELAEAESRRREVTMPPALWRAVEHIDRNFTREISIRELAAQAGVSPPHLHLLFRRQLGVAPRQLILRRRLTLAQELLASSRLSAKEICFAAGFRDPAYFGARFREATGRTPGDYRREFLQR